jgi:hypothetical protein
MGSLWLGSHPQGRGRLVKGFVETLIMMGGLGLFVTGCMIVLGVIGAVVVLVFLWIVGNGFWSVVFAVTIYPLFAIGATRVAVLSVLSLMVERIRDCLRCWFGGVNVSPALPALSRLWLSMFQIIAGAIAVGVGTPARYPFVAVLLTLALVGPLCLLAIAFTELHDLRRHGYTIRTGPASGVEGDAANLTPPR